MHMSVSEPTHCFSQESMQNLYTSGPGRPGSHDRSFMKPCCVTHMRSIFTGPVRTTRFENNGTSHTHYRIISRSSCQREQCNTSLDLMGK